MKAAIKEAKKALALGEIPVGAVVVHNGEIIAKGHNLRETKKDPTLHAEIVAISRAAGVMGDWRMNECDIYVTLEPCIMCSGAIINSRMRSVFFGAYDGEYGGAGGRIDLFASHCYGSKTLVFGGIMESECSDMINGFFKELRQRNG